MTNSEAIVWEGFVALDLPRSWDWSEEDGTITIYNPNGVGALQLSFASHQHAADLELLTSELARDVALEASHVKLKVELGGVPAAYVEGYSRGDERDFWRIWHAAALPTRMARITYNCPADHSSVETRDVDRILASCRWLAPTHS